MTIWKYPLDLFEAGQQDGRITIEMPVAANVIHVDTQHNMPVLWAEVNPENVVEERTFFVVGTGHVVPDQARYIGSALTHEGAFVWHIYERTWGVDDGAA